MAKQPPLELSKWYLDCVAPNGDVFIAYCAELRWRALPIHYTSVLEHSGATGTRTRHSLRSCRPPEIRGATLTWQSASLRVRGTWSACEPPVSATILDSDAGAVEWQCLMPRARAEAGVVAGLGYVEHLRLTLPPWNLPIRELRWGRFLCESDSLVWTDWRGTYSTQAVFHNGKSVRLAQVSEREIVCEDPDCVLALDPGRVLREGPLGANVLSALPDARKLFPGRILGVRECKWLSQAVLRRPGAPDTAGWAIHELVEWP